MTSNYRKSPGRFGEIGNEVGIERPPVRPSIAFPNASNALRNFGSESGPPSMESSDSTPTTALCFSTTEADDMSSLGDDPSILAVLFPTTPTKSISDDVIATSSQTTSQTMTTLMDLFHPTDSPSEQQLQWNVDVVDKGTIDPDPLSEVVKKKKKKKTKKPDENLVKKTKVTSENKKSKGEKSKAKVNKSKEDATSTKTKKKERLDREKKKSSPSDPSSETGIKSSKDPTKKETKKSRKSDSSPLQLNQKEEKKLKKSIKADVVVPSSTHEKLKNNDESKSKRKTTTREKSSSQTDRSPGVSPATKDINGPKSCKRKSASEDIKSRPLCISSIESNNSTSPTRLDSMLVSMDEKADDCSFDARSYYSCARSTFTYDCFDLPDSTKLYNDDRLTPATGIGGLAGTPNRTLELAIASAPKERPTGTDPKVQKKSKGHFLKRLFGENHSNQGCQ